MATAKWLKGEPQVNQSTCSLLLLPRLEGGEVQWPDVCRCPVNGGTTFELHELQANCVAGSESEVDAPAWHCTCPEGDEHLPNCPFDNCPVGQCHPMCAQVASGTHVIGHVSGEALYCHCPCHG